MLCLFVVSSSCLDVMTEPAATLPIQQTSTDKPTCMSDTPNESVLGDLHKVSGPQLPDTVWFQGGRRVPTSAEARFEKPADLTSSRCIWDLCRAARKATLDC